MKIKPEHYEFLRSRIAPLDTPERRAQYKSAALSAKHYRWSLLWSTGIKIGDGVGMKGDIDLYAYANDDHIDTALRSIVCTDDNF